MSNELSQQQENKIMTDLDILYMLMLKRQGKVLFVNRDTNECTVTVQYTSYYYEDLKVKTNLIINTSN